MKKPRVGLLPFYLELYDIKRPERRPRIEGFYGQIAAALTDHGLEVSTVPVCRLKSEFNAAIHKFENEEVDAIVTLHLAYSPSLESSEALASTPLPLVVLDTTPSYSYGPGQDPEEVSYNHGIHGVQDMCNLLNRNGKSFLIAAGHWQKSDVLDRVASFARSVRLAASMRRARVGRLGPAFVGMGDFAVPPAKLKDTLGVQTIEGDAVLVRSFMAKVSDQAVEAEISSDRERFVVNNLDSEVHQRSTRAGLVIRNWIEQEKLTAFTINFMAVDKSLGLPTMPFLEASKAMARGIGYAGEGDVLTAALVGALASVYPQTSFTEMFCPDWEGNQIFLSHMGEMNISSAASTPTLVEMPFPFTDVGNPAVAVARFRAGEAVLVNLAPARDDTYSLIVAPIVMQDVKGADRMADSIHGWFKAALPVGDFLAEYSRAGGTHHSALVYGNAAEEIVSWGKLMRWNTVVLK
jgi:L-arabinose isomerase